ncbi:MAG: dephospho-CoA kinase [Candidatus Fischerbacteria bacterium RBG_13_37_8]|uniref:Dephospho-CoA kinase n=1 Tax=Candidatus Fischerbacteria bacterium RBG_13_37_8 TaxID=1817863 RepID=A0A1F5VJG6_9BACT|nr:MAG: dephospho-CoA kinase [Candidatus Fischerbacteria bacterium RBG_13_37_8]
MKERITNKHSLIAGLTGSIATGKSLVASYFEQMGAFIIEADKIYADLVSPGRPLLKLIAMEFGKEILNQDGSLNRKIMGQKAFSSEDNRLKLNRITHPFIINTIIEKINEAIDKKIILVTAPLIIESNMLSIFDCLIVIVCSREQQIERLMKRDVLTKEEAESRIIAQLSSEDKLKYADYVINNSETREKVYQNTYHIYTKLQKSTK